MAVKDAHDGYAMYLLEPRASGAAPPSARRSARGGRRRRTRSSSWTSGTSPPPSAVRHVAARRVRHADLKDKEFASSCPGSATPRGAPFKRVPKNLVDEAVEAAKAALESDDEMDA